MRNVECGMRNELARRNIVLEKSFDFAVGIVRTARRLQLDRREWVLSKQLIRSGTSIGANIEEAIAAQSKKDFLSKMSIALKEARETPLLAPGYSRLWTGEWQGNGGAHTCMPRTCQDTQQHHPDDSRKHWNNNTGLTLRNAKCGMWNSK